MSIKCAIDVRKDIINTVNKVAVNSRAFSPVQGEDFILQVNNPKQANVVANQINRDYKEGLFRPSYSDPDNFYTIDPSEGLINRYLQSHSQNNNIVKEGVNFVFNENPELSKIGKPEEYSNYLNKNGYGNIYYHYTESNRKFDKFDKERIGSANLRNNSNIDTITLVDTIKAAQGFGYFGLHSFYAMSKEDLDSTDKEYLENINRRIVPVVIKSGTKAIVTENNHGKEINIQEINNLLILGSKDDIEGFKKWKSESNNSYLQTSTEDNIPQASPETLKKVNLFLERIGVDVKKLDKIVDSTGQTISANGRANLLKGLIEVVNGKEDKALPEEAGHFAVDIIEQKNPKLFNEMLNKVGQFQLYKDIINDNSENSYRNIYQTPEGKPDIRKIKKEVMGKLLAEAVINIDSEKSYPEEKAGLIQQWWKQIKEFLATLFSKTNVNPFNIAAKDILSGKNIGKASDIKGAELFYSRNDAIIKANMKLVGVLNLPKARDIFSRFYQKGQRDIFFNKLTSDLQAPKNQVEILKQWVDSHNPSSLDDMITGIASEMSYVVEINTAKISEARNTGVFGETHLTQNQIVRIEGQPGTWRVFGDNGELYNQEDNLPTRFYDFESVENSEDPETNPNGLSPLFNVPDHKIQIDNTLRNTQHYSNLTVPGGTNYTENEISTPAIVPSIKGHAQFSTDNGIGWFRSDELLDAPADYLPDTKFTTRRILEVQSDLFQKGRDKKNLITSLDDKTGYGGNQTTAQEYRRTVDSNENNFLQLLNKDNNWVTFFVKSIIQDSAKKGYEKVLFPTGNTASKIEGHTTLEEFKKQKEDRIKQLEEQNKDRELYDEQGNKFEELDFLKKERIENNNKEITQLKQELKRVETEGFGALKPIFKFYEENVTNILKKIGNTEKFTDEYGNTWNQYTLSDRDKGEFYYQLDNEDRQAKIDQKLMSTKDEVKKRYAEEEATDDEADNWYERAGKKVKNRVTDLVKKPVNYHPTDKQKRDNEVKRSNGVSGHLDFEKIEDSIIDPATHDLRPSPLEIDSESAIGNRVGFERMKAFISDLISNHEARHPGAKYYKEVVIYDSKNDRAGTIDFLIIDKDGTAWIYDWKFLSIKQGENDVPYYKQDAATIQIREYRRILKDEYGVKKFGETRAIPIIMEYYTDYRTAPFLTGMKIGSADTSKIEEIKYLPIPVDEETGIEPLDKKIKQLVNLYNKAEKKRAKIGEEDTKAYKLNTLKQAIRVLRAQSNLHVFVDTMQVNAGEMQQVISNYNNNIKGRDPKSLSKQEKSDFGYSMLEQLSTGEMYSNLDTSFDSVIQDQVENGIITPERARELRTTLNDAASEVRINMDKLKKIQREFANVFIGQAYGIQDLLLPEKVFKGLFSRFTGMTKIPNSSINVLYHMSTEADENARMDALEMNEKVFKLRTKTLEWAKSKGLKATDVERRIYKKGKEGERVHKLIDQIQPEFYKQLKENAATGNMRWFQENVDLEAYKKEANQYIEERKADLNKRVYPKSNQTIADETEEQRVERERAHQEYRRNEDIKNLEEKYNIDITTFTNWNNFIMRRSIKDKSKWYTKEYKSILNTPLEEFYDLHQESNKLAADIGYLDAQMARTFTPFLRKTIADKIVWGGNFKPIQDFIDDLSVGENPSFYGEQDENGNIIPSIPRYYTSDIGKTKVDELGNSSVDYTDVSEDPFKNLIMFNTQLFKYKYFSEVEGMIQTVRTIEEFKGHLETDRWGNIKKKEGTTDNEIKGVGESAGNIKNFQLLDDFVNTVLYKQRYAQSSSDTAVKLIRPLKPVKELINKVAGKEVFGIDENPNPISLIKFMDALNRGVRLKVLALNPFSGIAVAFGNNLQVAAQAGEYFRYRDYLRNQNKILRHDFQSEKDKELFTELINTFLPLDKDLSTELYNRAGVKSLSKRTIGDMLMIFMAKPDEILEKSIFLSVLDGIMVQDGKFISIEKHVKDKYPNRNISASERNRVYSLIKKEVKELKASSALSKVAKVNKEGKLEIPGFDINNREEIIRLSQLTKTITRNANGNISEFNKSQNQMNVFSASAMVFRGWIPTLVSTRFAELHKTADSFEGERYDIGRIRLMGRILMDSLTQKALLISHILNMNDKGLQYISELFEKYKVEYENRTGKDFNMNKDDFIDLIQNNIRNEVKELSFLLGLTSALLALGAMAPDDDDKRKKNLHAIAYRTFDKMQNEISFFYDPRSVLDLTNGGIFPSTQIFTDIWKFGDSIRGEIFDDEEENKNNRPLKRFAKLLPVSSAWITYVGVVDPDLAHYLQITIPTTSQTYH